MTTETLQQPAVVPPDKAPHRRRGWVIGAVLLVLVAALALRAWWPEQKADIRDGTVLVNADGMAARYGIDVTLVGVTAAGGLIEFRYQVVDPDKANPVLHDADLAPIVVVEETGATLVMRAPPHSHNTDLELGGTYYFLLANSHNAVRPGASVTLVIGDARLEHIVAQG